MSGLGNLYKKWLNVPDGQIGWYPLRSERTRSIKTTELRFDICQLLARYFSSVAWKLSKKHGVPWVAEMRDLWTLSPYLNLPKWRLSLEKKLEKIILRTAIGFVTVSEPLARDLRTLVDRPVEVINNGFDPKDYPEKKSTNNSNAKIKIIHTGTIYPGKRDPSILFKALNRLGQEKDKFSVEFYGRYTGFLKLLIEKYNLSQNVSIYASVDHKTSLQLQSEAEITLLLLWDNHKEEGSFTGKFFEYIGAQRPILVIGPKENVRQKWCCKRN